MNRMVTIFVIGFFFTTGMALARPGDNFGNGGGDRGGSGWSGGGDRGGGGGWNNSGGNGGGWNAGGNTNTGSSANSGNVSGHAESRGDGGSHTHSSSHFSGHFSSPAAHSFSSNNGIHSYSPFSGSHSNGNWYRGNTSRAFNRSEGFHHFSSNSGWGQTSQGIRRFHRFNSPNNSQAYRSHGSIAFQNNGITHRSASLTSRATLPTGFQRRAPALPSHGPLGRHFSSPTLSPRQMSSASVRAQMAAIAGNRTFMAKVAATTPVAGRYNHYYWHTWNGYNYCIYYAPYGGCWYGWDCGAGFFWTQYYAGNWWWYDPWYGHWCWWWDDGWWWQDPATTTVYIYNNGNYTPTDSNASYQNNSASTNSDDNGGPVYGADNTTSQNDENADNEESSAGQNEGSSVDFLSQDGSVKVTVSAQGDAFLYKMKNSKASGKPIYLDSNVDQVKFSNSGTKHEKILLIFKDGSFTTLSTEGRPVDGART